MTGPMMFDGVSHPPMPMAQDSVRKAAPVDTAMLKERMANTAKDAATLHAKAATDPFWAEPAARADARLTAKQDTLNAARKKKGG